MGGVLSQNFCQVATRFCIVGGAQSLPFFGDILDPIYIKAAVKRRATPE